MDFINKVSSGMPPLHKPAKSIVPIKLSNHGYGKPFHEPLYSEATVAQPYLNSIQNNIKQNSIRRTYQFSSFT